MKNNNFYILLFLLVGTLSFGQQKRVTTSVDSTKIKIGAQLNLTLKTTVDTLSNVVFPEGTTFGQLEVLESYPTDTVKENDKYLLTKRYGLTQFDSGKYMLPSLKVLINDKPYVTDSLLVQVASIKVDTLKQKMYDIKGIAEVEEPMGNWWKWLLGILLLAAIGVLIYFLAKKYKRKEKPEEIVYATPIEKAVSLLKNLEQKELWQKGEIKDYYSQLTDIARTYIEEEIQVPAMESTTSEVIAGLRSAAVRKKMKISKETVENLERVLRQADLVKFAKSKPLEFEIAEDRSKIEKTIFTLHKAIPEIEEEEDETLILDAKRREMLLKKKRKRKIVMTSFGIGFLVLIAFGYFMATSGMEYLKDNFIGHPTKDLVEGEWVKSDYGNPAVTMETPKVLKRIASPKLQANVRESQRFGYGSIVGGLSISVATTSFKDTTQVPLEKIIEREIKIFEASLKAKDVFVKQDKFDTGEGITGQKAYGSMTVYDPEQDKSLKLAYQIIVFAQDGGLQEIIITHLDNDEFGAQIADRIINSVELKKVN
jgi:Ca2+/Na+ antiporter